MTQEQAESIIKEDLIPIKAWLRNQYPKNRKIKWRCHFTIYHGVEFMKYNMIYITISEN